MWADTITSSTRTGCCGGASRHPTNRLWALGGDNDDGVLCEDCGAHHRLRQGVGVVGEGDSVAGGDDVVVSPTKSPYGDWGGEGRLTFVGVLVEDVFVGGHDNVLYEDWMWVGASRHPTNRLWALGGVNDYGVLCEDCGAHHRLQQGVGVVGAEDAVAGDDDGVLCEDCARFAVPVGVYKKSPSARGFFMSWGLDYFTATLRTWLPRTSRKRPLAGLATRTP